MRENRKLKLLKLVNKISNIKLNLTELELKSLGEEQRAEKLKLEYFQKYNYELELNKNTTYIGQNIRNIINYKAALNKILTQQSKIIEQKDTKIKDKLNQWLTQKEIEKIESKIINNKKKLQKDIQEKKINKEIDDVVSGRYYRVY